MHLNSQIAIFRHINPIQLAAFTVFKEGQAAYRKARAQGRDPSQEELEQAMGAPLETIHKLFKRAARLPAPEIFQ